MCVALRIFLKWFRNLSGARLGSGSDGLQGATGDKMAIRLGLQSVPRLKVILVPCLHIAFILNCLILCSNLLAPFVHPQAPRPNFVSLSDREKGKNL